MNLTEWNARLHGLVIFRALLADAEHKKRAAAPQKKRYDFDF